MKRLLLPLLQNLVFHSFSSPPQCCPPSLLFLPYTAFATGVASTTRKHMFVATVALKLLRGILSRQQHDSILAFLKSYGFDDASVKRLVHYSTKCLILDVEKTLVPKFRAFKDKTDTLKSLISLVEDLRNATDIRDVPLHSVRRLHLKSRINVSGSFGSLSNVEVFESRSDRTASWVF
ncbi:hypothetical protein ZIOFF_039550 [Zingiber officinale]|uniref:Uncharacterized protein n=1 Tax=Zingiber officinale TaxID=94328 RepID=A0A8J5G2G4_ZINOF|nr:hypothetical protein ZIOFF_039550 [Zingiber officinale]